MDNAMRIINSYNENDALKADLAAANARIAELENKLTSHAPDGQQYNNAQFVEMRQCAEQAEAQNKRMRELLIEIKSYAETYVDLNPRMKHIIDCAKAALEAK